MRNRADLIEANVAGYQALEFKIEFEELLGRVIGFLGQGGRVELIQQGPVVVFPRHDGSAICSERRTVDQGQTRPDGVGPGDGSRDHFRLLGRIGVGNRFRAELVPASAVGVMSLLCEGAKRRGWFPRTRTVWPPWLT